eukprot:505165-Alexandrium_andersonii.AAC.1
MSASLVGSEMCIRDRSPRRPPGKVPGGRWGDARPRRPPGSPPATLGGRCLLYTSDAADDM